MLIDSNIIIYAAKPEHTSLRQFIATHVPAVSAVSKIEVLGFHRLTQEEREHFEEFFGATTVLPISDAVVATAISLRQIRKMSLGDSLIAATALEFDHKLITRNISDFVWVADLVVEDPFQTPP